MNDEGRPADGGRRCLLAETARPHGDQRHEQECGYDDQRSSHRPVLDGPKRHFLRKCTRFSNPVRPHAFISAFDQWDRPVPREVESVGSGRLIQVFIIVSALLGLLAVESSRSRRGVLTRPV